MFPMTEFHKLISRRLSSSKSSNSVEYAVTLSKFKVQKLGHYTTLCNFKYIFQKE